MAQETPIAPYNRLQRFSATGQVQEFRVPEGVTSLDARVWGSGGGGDNGGGGGFSSGTVAVTSGEVLKVVVGSDSFGGVVKLGGGMSGLYRPGVGPLLIAGGGGAAFVDGTLGGAGGGDRGGDGTATSSGSYTGTPARGAAGPKGGAGMTCNAGADAGNGGDLGQNGGGNGGQIPLPGMGGGGGNGMAANHCGGGAGYAGGGGGGGWGGGGGSYLSGGGGGSGYASGPGVSNGQTVAGAGRNSAGKSDPFYQAGIGDNRQPGQVVLQWQLVVARLTAEAGAGQTADQAEQFGQPLTAKAWSADGTTPVPGEVVTFTVTQGDASFADGTQSASATTDNNGQATTPALTAGTTPGPVTVTAKSGSAEVVFPLEVTPAFSVSPGGPPDVHLIRGGAVGYPGVHVTSGLACPPVSVTVALPAGGDLRFGTETLPDHQLTVQTGDGQTTPYTGTLSPDGTTLTFTDVDLALPGTTVMWVAASAGHDAPLGTTSLDFTVGGKNSPCTTTVVMPAFTMAPGGTPKAAQRGGPPVYPGVEVRNGGARDIPPQTVTVTLPDGAGLRFGTPDNPDHQLTVWDGDHPAVAYPGTLSADGQSLTFSDVDLAIPTDGSVADLWVCVSAGDDSPPGPTSVEFSVGDQVSRSTSIDVV
ncbi:hypothetical protein [Streptomyces huiliensis]|uniref:hypothetical protein n=1 Tax=Streptomyces huiliensis TaxID=2876027 RepID=UPI001CBA74A6|nr:hypothetical protein [Streptomyces huiliensis]MBZ4321225.1 hypothetical protein [Streptomyces huiliensis]